ncbi:acyl-CoA carboxylase epsilon subunit [Nonomuraea sp. NBC_00507]|uniref:acyl-CoA carboxylase epsilon subunit n=1 Tax=Nonomuraea sp. NBC_00507 TaxID=2976002 RepID=UPI003FA60D8C
MAVDDVMLHFVRGEPDQEEVAAVMVALRHKLATRTSRPPAWNAPEAFRAPNSWASREINGRGAG